MNIIIKKTTLYMYTIHVLVYIIYDVFFLHMYMYCLMPKSIRVDRLLN